MRCAGIAILLGLLCSLSRAAAPATQPSIDRQCAQLLASWHGRFADEHVAVVIAPPFVIPGDGGIERIEHSRDPTILAARRALAATYFDKQPAEPILILLFESAAPYRRLAKKWFNDDDVPHF